MNKLYLGGIIFTALMLLLTYLSVGGSEGGLNDDIVNMLAITGAVALVIITVFVVIKYVRQMQNDKADGELADEQWDGIGEYKNELPFGWAVMFFILIIWGAWYFLHGYPPSSYSQIGEYNEDTKVHNDKFSAQYADITGDRLVEMGESVFLAECKICHGLNADGIDGKAADLNVWGSAQAVLDTINNGSKGMNYPMGEMPAGMASGQDAKNISEYVANGLTGTTGAEAYAIACASCHGEDGKGMGGMSPDLSTYDTPAFTVDVLNRGKKGFIGEMPKFDRLNAKQKEAVGAYINSLSK